MYEFGWAQPAEEGQLLDVINMVFSMDGNATDFRSLVPRVFSKPGFSAISLVARQAGRIVAVVSVDQATLHLGQAALRTGFIGNVAVHPYHRGQGLMKELMTRSTQAMVAQGVDLALLGGHRQRYSHFGYEWGTARVVLNLSAGSLRHTQGPPQATAFQFVPLAQAEKQAVDAAFGLHNAADLHVARSRDSFPLALCSYGVKPFLVYEQEQLLGYFCLSGELITECCFYDKSRLPNVLATFLAQQGQEDIQISLRPDQLNEHPGLMAAADGCNQRPVFMAQVFNWPSVLGALMALAAQRKRLIDGEGVLEVIGQGSCLLSVQGGKPSVAPTHRSGDLCLSPQAALSLISPVVSAQLYPAHPFYNWLPLPLDFPLQDAF